MSTTHSKFAPIAICLAFGLAACGDDNTSTADETTTPVDAGDGGGYDLPPAPTVVDTVGSETSATDASDTSVDDSGGEVDVMLADSSLGQILVDAAGNTLYLFANDPPDVATCTGSCASSWPPMPASDDSVHVGDGLDDDLFEVVTGESGLQISFDGHPLYYYAGDSAPGDTNGNGVGNVWFAIGADGDPVT